MTTTGRTLERVSRALRTHVPELAVHVPVALGGGLDHVAFVAAGLVLRVADDRSVVNEARLLRLVGPHLPIPVPTPRFADENAGVLAYPLLSGRPLLGRTPPPRAAGQLGEFLGRLHAVDLTAVSDLVPTEYANPDEWLADLDGPAELLRIVHTTVPEPSPYRVLAHADLGAEHILEHRGALSGIIDWSDAAITDPAVDFARLYRDFGPAFLEETLTAYGGDLRGAMPRIKFFARCAALEDLAYGRATGRLEYARAAQLSLTRLFPEAAAHARALR